MKFTVTVEFEEDEYKLIDYSSDKTMTYEPDEEIYKQTFMIGSIIETPFFKFTVNKVNLDRDLSGKEYFVKFNNYNSVVKKFSKIDVSTLKKGTSLIELSLNGPNKKKIEDFINATVEVLDTDQRKQKIQYAIKTKEYIDTLFIVESKNLKNIESDLGSFKQKNDIYDLSAEGSTLLQEATTLDAESLQLKNRLDYYNNLESYIRSRDKYDESIPAPALVNIEDPNITSSVTTLISLSKAKETLELTVKSSYPPLKKIINEIDLEKQVLLEHLSTIKVTTKNSLNSVNKQISKNNSKLRTLSPKRAKAIEFSTYV